MTLFAYMDEHGAWQVSHIPPRDGSAVLMIALPEGVMPTFLDYNMQEEVEVTIR